MRLTIAYARVSTRSGEQLSALPVQIAWLEAQGPDLVLHDVERGRVTTRPNYQQLRGMIERGLVDRVIATEFSRLGRNSEESDAFVRLCDRHCVRVDTQRDGRLTMATPDDLVMTRLKSSQAEAESMRLSQRVNAAITQGRAMGKPMRRPAWGYRLRADRLAFEPNPDTWPAAARFVDALQAASWRMLPTLAANRATVPFRSARGVRVWLLNPVLRGGIGYGQGPSHTYREIRWGQHPALLSAAQFAEFERVVETNRRMWGANAARRPRILTGLVVCAECGHRLKYIAGRVHPSLRCYGDLCSQLYRSTREAVIVEFALEAIRAEALERLAAMATAEEPPDARELRRQIEALERLGDPDLAAVIDAKRARLEQLLTRQPVDAAMVQRLADPRFWDLATAEELAAILRAVVRRVTVTRQAPTAIDLRL